MAINSTAILQTVEHRTHPLPVGQWIMTQIWHELLFAHWPFTPESLRPLIPSTLTLDTFKGQAWLGIVPFRMTDVSLRGVPALPWISHFPELNVRTYVRVNDVPGVYFFSLDAGNSLAVTLARKLFHLPYFHARMTCQLIGDTVHYASHRIHRGAPAAEFAATYRPITPANQPLPGTLEYWFTERYCLYTVLPPQRVYRCDIHHRPWPLQTAELEMTKNRMAKAGNIHLPDTPPLLHYSHRQEVLIWPLHAVKS